MSAGCHLRQQITSLQFGTSRFRERAFLDEVSAAMIYMVALWRLEILACDVLGVHKIEIKFI
jgi:hypothetical protein